MLLNFHRCQLPNARYATLIFLHLGAAFFAFVTVILFSYAAVFLIFLQSVATVFFCGFLYT